MTEEHWKEIEDYPGYLISDQGRVRSLDRIVERENRYGRYQVLVEGRLLKTSKDKDGYLRVGLRMDGRSKTFKVHRLVAIAFIPNPNNYPIINHKDEDKTNNCASNLEWCDAKYNTNYGTRNKRASETMKGMTHSEETKRKIGEALKNHPSKSKPVACYTLKGKFVAEFPSTREAARVLNCFATDIVACLRGRSKSYKGYVWRYA